MTSNALASLEYDATTAKRATWEAFEFAVPIEGTVVVTNASYGAEKNDHAYAVNVKSGVPTDCVCDYDQFNRRACKHRVAVAIREPVLEAASASRSAEAEKRAMPDGGVVSAARTLGSSDGNRHAEGCDNPECEGFGDDAERPLLSWECWEVWS